LLREVPNSTIWWIVGPSNRPGGDKSAVEVRIDYGDPGTARLRGAPGRRDPCGDRHPGDGTSTGASPQCTTYRRHCGLRRTLRRFTAYDALRGKAVCHGYALLAFDMYRALGYEVRISSGGDHAWNLIRVGGNWDHVDTTFDDPTYDFQGHFTPEEKRRIAGEIRRNYLLQDDATMWRSGHVWDRSAFPPAPVRFPSVKKCEEEKRNEKRSKEGVRPEGEGGARRRALFVSRRRKLPPLRRPVFHKGLRNRLCFLKKRSISQTIPCSPKNNVSS
jgi:hypothetical protein